MEMELFLKKKFLLNHDFKGGAIKQNYPIHRE